MQVRALLRTPLAKCMGHGGIAQVRDTASPRCTRGEVLGPPRVCPAVGAPVYAQPWVWLCLSEALSVRLVQAHSCPVSVGGGGLGVHPWIPG